MKQFGSIILSMMLAIICCVIVSLSGIEIRLDTAIITIVLLAMILCAFYIYENED